MESTERNNILNNAINKTMIVVYNQKTNIYNDLTSDFFSKEEISFIKSIANESSLDIEFIKGELSFINNINNYFPSEIVVLNLTRRGSNCNKKCAVTTLCDLKGISVIGSSALAMTLCRHKDLLAPLLESVKIKYPLIIKKYDDIKNDTLYIMKHVNSAGSLGLTKNSVIRGSNLNLDQLSTDIVIQEYIEGYELEVPFIILNGQIHILGVFTLTIGETSYYDSTNECILNYENSDDFNYSLTKISIDHATYNKLQKMISEGCNLLGIENYGRFDFRTSNLNDIECYYLFDIATSPFFTENSSFFLGCKFNVFDTLFSTLD